MKNTLQILAATASEIRRRDRDEDWGFESMTGSQLNYMLNFSQKDIINDINKMYLKNPLAARIIRAKTNYVIGDGFNYQVEDNDDAQEVLDDFWKRNKMDIKLETRVNDLSVNGEQYVLPEASKNTGKVIVRYPFPGLLAEKKKRHRYDDDIAFFKLVDDTTQYEVMCWDEAKEKYLGNAWYFYINKPGHMEYGLSDIFDSRDWLKMYDKSLFTTMSRVGLILSFVWDILIKTKDPGTLKRKIEYFRKHPPSPGSVNVHNETETLEPMSPKLQGNDLDKIYKLLKGQCMAGTGTPEFIFGLGGDVNRATSMTMLEPYFKDVKARQKYWEYIYKTIFDYVLWEAISHNVLHGKLEDIKYTCGFAEPDESRIKEYSDALVKFSNAAVVLTANNIIEEIDAKNVIKLLLMQIGVDIKIDEETNNKIKAAIQKAKGNLKAGRRIGK